MDTVAFADFRFAPLAEVVGQRAVDSMAFPPRGSLCYPVVGQGKDAVAAASPVVSAAKVSHPRVVTVWFCTNRAGEFGGPFCSRNGRQRKVASIRYSWRLWECKRCSSLPTRVNPVAIVDWPTDIRTSIAKHRDWDRETHSGRILPRAYAAYHERILSAEFDRPRPRPMAVVAPNWLR